MIDNGIIIEKAIRRIADEYGFDIGTVENALIFSDESLDIDAMVSEGIFCFRGPNDNVKYDNASICVSNKILSNTKVAKTLIPLIGERIRKWDHEDISVLLSLLKKVVTIMELNPDEYPCLQACSINPAELPSEKIPKDIGERYCIWAMDKKGMCLVGIDANRMMHIDDIRKNPEDETLVC
ncbi:hypothetical protein [Methanolobus psychrotolerans]|uniref:hypothetical protein n=1 Tax=Methanolobus psychrotolerans TaxID=1874706 RepID=UPI001F5C68C4|nr:hypothetical protein [Methanolobus psychrotolerans]